MAASAQFHASAQLHASDEAHCLTFLTDYGLEDGFVAACHGVCAQIAPKARIIDITHLVPPGDIRRGAAVLAQTVPYLPAGAVHVAVVDPGVGTPRRGIAVAAGGSFFVGPDNGLLSWAVADAVRASGEPARAFSLTNRALWLHDTVPATFHGRDIFMPVAAHLAAGTPVADAGEEIAASSLAGLARPLSRLIKAARGSATTEATTAGTAGGTWRGVEGEVLTVDRFGNVQLSVTGADAARAGAVPGTAVRLRWGTRDLAVPFGATFGDVPPGELLAYTDAAGLVSLAVNGGSAARRLAPETTGAPEDTLAPGTRVTISVTPE